MLENGALEECLGSNIETGCDHDMIELIGSCSTFLSNRRNLGFEGDRGPSFRVEAAKMLSERLSDGHALGLETVARTTWHVGSVPAAAPQFWRQSDFEELLDDTRRSEAIVDLRRCS